MYMTFEEAGLIAGTPEWEEREAKENEKDKEKTPATDQSYRSKNTR